MLIAQQIEQKPLVCSTPTILGKSLNTIAGRVSTLVKFAVLTSILFSTYACSSPKNPTIYPADATITNATQMDIQRWDIYVEKIQDKRVILGDIVEDFSLCKRLEQPPEIYIYKGQSLNQLRNEDFDPAQVHGFAANTDSDDDLEIYINLQRDGDPDELNPAAASDIGTHEEAHRIIACAEENQNQEKIDNISLMSGDNKVNARVITNTNSTSISIMFDSDTTFVSNDSTINFAGGYRYELASIEEVAAQILLHAVSLKYKQSEIDLENLIITAEDFSQAAYGDWVQDVFDAIEYNDPDGQISFTDFNDRVTKKLLDGGAQEFFTTLPDEAKSILIQNLVESYTK